MSQELKLLYPLDEFYARAGLIVPRVSRVDGEDVPQPYRRLLVHDHDMTPTLEAYHEEKIHLRVIGRRQDGDAFSRLVVLTTNDTERSVEFGAIVIHLEHFPPAAREAVLECHTPLGTILADYRIAHSSRPDAFIRVTSDPLIKGAVNQTGLDPLYGRRNALSTPDGRVLADVVEILPTLKSGDE
jgi:chorismate-pyruvate lyase